MIASIPPAARLLRRPSRRPSSKVSCSWARLRPTSTDGQWVAFSARSIDRRHARVRRHLRLARLGDRRAPIPLRRIMRQSSPPGTGRDQVPGERRPSGPAARRSRRARSTIVPAPSAVPAERIPGPPAHGLTIASSTGNSRCPRQPHARPAPPTLIRAPRDAGVRCHPTCAILGDRERTTERDAILRDRVTACRASRSGRSSSTRQPARRRASRGPADSGARFVDPTNRTVHLLDRRAGAGSGDERTPVAHQRAAGGRPTGRRSSAPGERSAANATSRVGRADPAVTKLGPCAGSVRPAPGPSGVVDPADRDPSCREA